MDVTQHPYSQFIEEAVQDGWKMEEGPWGYNADSELTVKLSKHFPGLTGEVILWMVWRNLGQMVWSDEQKRWHTIHPDSHWQRGVTAWHKYDDSSPHSYSLSSDLEDVLRRGLDEDYWQCITHTCDRCGNVVDEVEPYAYANKACRHCLKALNLTQMEYSD